MKPGSLMNPPTGVLPFDMFRSFAPVFEQSRPSTAQPSRCDIYETDKEIVLKLEPREMKRCEQTKESGGQNDE